MDRIALITGGARGIGLGISESLAKEGFHLALSGRKASSEVSEALDGLRRHGVEVLYVRSDVSSEEIVGGCSMPFRIDSAPCTPS